MFKSLKDALGRNIIIIVAIILMSTLGFVGYKITMDSLATIKNSNFALSNIVLTEQKSIDTILTKTEIEELIKNYIISNPEIIVQSLEGLQESRIKERNEKISFKIQDKKDQIFDTENTPYLGNKNAPVKIVAFMDYNCGYCKKANDALNQLLADDPNVCVIYRLHPIMSDASEYLAKLALAVNKITPTKFKEVHDKFMGGKIGDKESLISTLHESNINLNDLEEAIRNPELQNTLKQSNILAKYIGISGVPAMIVNDKLYPGFLDIERLKSIVEEAKSTHQDNRFGHQKEAI